MKAVIIEDETNAQSYLEHLARKNFPYIEITAIEATVQNTIAYLNSSRPDIVFMDIELLDGTGFDVLAALEYPSFELIFTTAYNKYAIEAFKVHAIDYLLKPIEEQQLIKSVNHCISCREQKSNASQISNLLKYMQHSLQPHRHLNVPHSKGVDFVDFDDILYLSAKGCYTQLHLKNLQTMLVCRNIKEVEKSLPHNSFFRIHNSYIINAQYISKYNKGRGGDIVLCDGTALPVSVNRKEDFMSFFNLNAFNGTR